MDWPRREAQGGFEMVGSLLRDYSCAVLYYAIHLSCMTSLVRPQEVDHFLVS
jgi:hypothetical protein